MTGIVFIAQIIFLYLRTLNVKAVANDDMWRAVWTGWGIGITWMIGIAIGASAMMEGHPLPIVAHLAGGTIGTWMGMRETKKKSQRDKPEG